MSDNDNSHSELRANLKKAADSGTKVMDSVEFSTSQKRRGTRRPSESSKARFQLVEVDGVLDWEEVTAAPPVFRRRRRGLGTTTATGAIATIEFKKLPPSDFVSFLAARDDSLTPQRGLRRWDPDSARLVPAQVPASGNVLLFIHGTFSNSDNVVNSLQGTKDGKKFLADMSRKYDGNIYTFDHPTLSISPILNAMDLSREIGQSKANFDIITHSRGGLVTRWWCEAFDPHRERCQKAILVGSPLAGTGLAAPPNIRATIRLLSNVASAAGKVAGLATAAVPLFSIVEVLLQVLSTITSWTAKTPIVDAAVALVPGLFAQSRVGNNPELLRLLQMQTDPSRYYGVISNFTPGIDDRIWQFWRIFRKDRLLDLGADLLFGDENDLVVDTASMTHLMDGVAIPPNQILNFGNSPKINHLNYFDDIKTLDFWRDVLEKRTP